MTNSGSVVNVLVEIDRQVQKQEEKCKIEESMHNRKYKTIITPELPIRYLKREEQGNVKKIIAIYRCDNEEKVNKHCMKQEDRVNKLLLLLLTISHMIIKSICLNNQ